MDRAELQGSAQAVGENRKGESEVKQIDCDQAHEQQKDREVREFFAARDAQRAAEIREAELREDTDERVEDLLPWLGEAPSGERVLELAEQICDVCPWLRSLGLERVSDSVVRVAGRRVAMGECEPW